MGLSELSSKNSLGNAWPLLFWDGILVDVDVVSIGVEVVVEHEWGVHEWARVHEGASLIDLHLLNVKDEHSVEDLESQSTFTSKDHDLLVCDLVSQTHIGWNPFGLVTQGWRNFLPRVSLNVVYFNYINDSLLINSTSKCKEILILETAEGNTRPRDIQRSNQLPFVFLAVVSFRVAVNSVVNEWPNNVDEWLNGTKWVISMRIEHVWFLFEPVEDLIITVTFVQVLVLSFDKATNQVDWTTLYCYWSRVKWDFLVHSNHSLFKLSSFDSVNLCESLVPLEGMKSLSD